MSLSQPLLLQHWFAQLNPTLMNSIPDSPATPYNASWQTGFQLANKTPLASGGVAPFMEDVNGTLAVLSQYAQWQSIGSPFTFNGTFATAVGGYPQGATVRDTALTQHAFVNLLAGNTNDPNTATNVTGQQTPGGWDFLESRGPGTAFGFVMALADHSTVANAIILHDDVYTAYVNGGATPGAVVIWKQAISNTGACTLTVNGTAGTLTRANGSAVAANDLVAGTTYIAELVDVTLQWRLLSYVPSYLSHPQHSSGHPATATATADGTAHVLGYAQGFTPLSTGKITLIISGDINTGGGQTVQLGWCIGTGTAPANNAALSGLPGLVYSSGVLNTSVPQAGIGLPFMISDIDNALAVGTAYWLDLYAITTTGTAVSLQSINFTIVEMS